jgi:hypothetical protein
LIRKLASATAVAAIAGALISSATANANGYPTEQLRAAELDAVEAAINGAVFKNPEKDQTSLLARFADAIAKVDEGKITDAVAKFDDIANTPACRRARRSRSSQTPARSKPQSIRPSRAWPVGRTS